MCKSAIKNLASLLRTEVFDKIDSYWSEAETYGTIELRDLGSGYYDEDRYQVNHIVPPKRSGRSIDANSAKGVYMWYHGDQVMYVGKTDAPSTSIHKRQYSHARSFTTPHERHESSGRKYREFLQENDLHSIDIVIKYINTDKFDIEGMAELIETATINNYQPLLNREIKGRGQRECY
jgi:hypothetical protein